MATQVKSNSANYNSFAKYKDDLIKVFARINSNDNLYDQAVAIVAKEQKASTSFIQRHLRIGYNRAATIIEKMEADGIISKANHVGKRDVLINDQ